MVINPEIVKQAKASDAAAFAELYETVYKDLYRFAYYTLKHPQDAEDVVSETVIDAYRGIHRLRSEEAFQGWIFKILSNKCKRKLKEYVGKTLTLDETLPLPEADYATGYDMHTAFSQLADDERLIVSMAVFGGYTSKEIGKILHMNDNTVRSRQSRALAKLKKKRET